jgi:hypothetical protein
MGDMTLGGGLGPGQPDACFQCFPKPPALGLHFRTLLGFRSPIRPAAADRDGGTFLQGGSTPGPGAVDGGITSPAGQDDDRLQEDPGTQAARNEASSGLSSSMRRAAKSRQICAI